MASAAMPRHTESVRLNGAGVHGEWVSDVNQEKSGQTGFVEMWRMLWAIFIGSSSDRRLINLNAHLLGPTLSKYP
jgi:hypothetical protein